MSRTRPNTRPFVLNRSVSVDTRWTSAHDVRALRDEALAVFLGRLHVLGERRRIRRHLSRVEAELRTRDVSGLPEERRAARARNLDRLRAYRRSGVFPVNTEVPGTVPHLRDGAGTPCAVAYLMDASGASAAVDGLAARDNHVRISDLRGGPLLDWLAEAGLSQQEAARIQPSYGHLPPARPLEPLPDPAPSDVTMTVILLVAWALAFVWMVLGSYLVWRRLRRENRGKPLRRPGLETYPSAPR